MTTQVEKPEVRGRWEYIERRMRFRLPTFEGDEDTRCGQGVVAHWVPEGEAGQRQEGVDRPQTVQLHDGRPTSSSTQRRTSVFFFLNLCRNKKKLMRGCFLNLTQLKKKKERKKNQHNMCVFIYSFMRHVR